MTDIHIERFEFLSLVTLNIFYVLYSSPISILQHSSRKDVFSIIMENSVNPDQMASRDQDLVFFSDMIRI